MANKNNARSAKKMCVFENLDSTKHSIQSMRSIREDKILSEEGTSISYADDEESGDENCEYEDCDDFEEDDARDYEDFVEELVDASSDGSALKSQDDFHVGQSTSKTTALSAVAASVVETAVREAEVLSRSKIVSETPIQHHCQVLPPRKPVRCASNPSLSSFT
jgi:hypothetical protein